MENNQQLIGTYEASQMLKISQRTVLRLIETGQLKPTLKAHGGPHGIYLFTKTSVEKLAQESHNNE